MIATALKYNTIVQLTLNYELSELSKVSFCVLDVETTGSDPTLSSLTEIAAVKVIGGEIVDRFESLLRPEHKIPQRIVALTGISDSMVHNAPLEEDILPQFLEFLGDSVPVGHNVNFDLRFINAACLRLGLDPPSTKHLDTLSLSRKLLVGEVDNFRLGTLSEYIKTYHRPSHRAMTDVLATVELLHVLIERAGQIGIHHLEDLRFIPAIGKRRSGEKVSMAAKLPHCCGTYLFLDETLNPIYVGKASDIQSRVRSYFGSEQRRKIPMLLERLYKIDYIVTPSTLEAEILERRLIRTFQPRFNFQQKTQELWWLSLEQDKALESTAFPPDTSFHKDPSLIGPFFSKHATRAALRALREGGNANLSGKDLLQRSRWLEELHINLESQMQTYAHRREFERAALLRDDAKTLLTKFATTYLLRDICSLSLVEFHELDRTCTISANYGRFNLGSNSPWIRRCQESVNDLYFDSTMAAYGLLKGTLTSTTSLTSLSKAQSIHTIAKGFAPKVPN